MSNKIERYVEESHDFGKEDLGNPPPGVMWVFVEDGAPVMIDMLCPCGCGHTCPTHLCPPNEEPTPGGRIWKLTRGPNGPTLRPSVRWTGGCLAHFTISDGKIEFHSDSGVKQ